MIELEGYEEVLSTIEGFTNKVRLVPWSFDNKNIPYDFLLRFTDLPSLKKQLEDEIALFVASAGLDASSETIRICQSACHEMGDFSMWAESGLYYQATQRALKKYNETMPLSDKIGYGFGDLYIYWADGGFRFHTKICFALPLRFQEILRGEAIQYLKDEAREAAIAEAIAEAEEAAYEKEMEEIEAEWKAKADEVIQCLLVDDSFVKLKRVGDMTMYARMNIESFEDFNDSEARQIIRDVRSRMVILGISTWK